MNEICGDRAEEGGGLGGESATRWSVRDGGAPERGAAAPTPEICITHARRHRKTSTACSVTFPRNRSFASPAAAPGREAVSGRTGLPQIPRPLVFFSAPSVRKLGLARLTSSLIANSASRMHSFASEVGPRMRASALLKRSVVKTSSSSSGTGASAAGCAPPFGAVAIGAEWRAAWTMRCKSSSRRRFRDARAALEGRVGRASLRRVDAGVVRT